MSPTARSLKRLRDAGYIADIVEKTIPYKFIKQDLFDCIDIVAVLARQPDLWTKSHVLMVQCTSDSNLASRVTKMNGIDAVRWLKNAGVHVQAWGWGKKGAAGKRKLWSCRVVEI